MRWARTEGLRKVATTMSPLRKTASVRAFPNPDDAPVTVFRRLGYALSQTLGGDMRRSDRIQRSTRSVKSTKTTRTHVSPSAHPDFFVFTHRHII